MAMVDADKGQNTQMASESTVSVAHAAALDQHQAAQAPPGRKLSALSPPPVPTPPPRAAWRRLPAGVWALGAVSMLTDISSELVHSLLPLYMVTVLGASMATVGWVEGIAEATASITKVFSGVWSDRLARRKPLVAFGYGLSALTKLVFPLATVLAWVAAARFADRLGKGIRDAPRDALLADIAPAPLRGAAYGLRQALDSVGAFVGPVLAIIGMAVLGGSITAVLWWAVLPATAAWVLVMVAVREPAAARTRPLATSPPWQHLGRLPAAYWRLVAFAALFTLARFSDAFLVLRAQQSGLSLAWVPVVLIVMNLAYALMAYPAGNAADRLPARRLLAAGLLLLMAADGLLAWAGSVAVVLLGALLWGLHMALTQGLLAKLVADAAPADLRGTAFGVYHLVGGLAMLMASVIAGSVWAGYGAGATFITSAGIAGLCLLALTVLTRHKT
jgi:MFS family permease